MSQQQPSGPPPGYNQGQGQQQQQPMRMGSPVSNRMMYMSGSPNHNQGNFMGPGGPGGRLPQQQQGGMMGPVNMAGPQGTGGMGGQGMMTGHQGGPGGMQPQRKPTPQPLYVQQSQSNQQSFNQGQPSPMASNSPSGNSPAPPNPNIMSQDGPKPSPQPVMGSRPNTQGPQQPQQQSQPSGTAVAAGGQPQQAGAQGPKSDLNTAYVCRIGQETVQEIVGRTQEVFSYLKALQPPVGNAMQDRAIIEKQQRLQEVLKGITHLFKRLNFCWTKAQV